MKTFQTQIFTILFLFATNTYGQIIDSTSSKVVGKWLLVKHTLPEKGKEKNFLTANDIYTQEFNADGTYQAKWFDKKLGATVNEGKWKLIDNGRKIHLYNISDVPDDPIILISDHDLSIIKLTTTEFVTEEYLFTEAPIGRSYYEKQN